MSKILLQINVTANWGSTGKIAEQIGLLAMQHGWDSYIAYGRMMNPSKSKLIKIGSQWDVYLHYILGRFLDMEGLASKRATRKLVKDIERIKPNVVHLHNIHDHYLNYPILFEYLAARDIPVVWTQHDLWAITGYCYYVPEGCEKWKSGCFDCPLSRSIRVDKSRRNYGLKKKHFSSLKSLTLVPVSNWLSDIMKQSFLKDCDIKVIHNGIDTGVFKTQDQNIHQNYSVEGKKVVLGVAHPWSERKGLKDYLSLSELLPDDCRIVLVGLSEEQRNNLPNNIIGLGVTQNVDELVMLYNMADIVLNLSYAETFGLTTAEGFACGTPGIVYNATASPELITSETGIVVEAGDIEGVAKAVLKILEKGKSYYSAACRKRAEEYYDKDKCFENYVELYESLI